MIFKNLTFDGISLKEYGVYISGEAVFDSPTREVEMITIPGRNGSFALDKGRFNNITVTYPAGIYATSETEFAEKVSTLRNLLASRKGYCRLTDEYNPDEFRLGVYKAGLELDPTHYNEAGRFELSFDCKPQRFLFSGEEIFTLGEWGQTETKSGSIVSFEGDETTAIKSLTAQIVPKQSGSGEPSPSNVRPISGTSTVNATRCGKNILPKMTAGTYSANGGTIVVDDNGVAHLSGTTTASGNVAIIPLETPITITQDMVDKGLYYHLRNSAVIANLEPTLENNSAVRATGYAFSPANRISPQLGDGVVGKTVTRIRFYVTSGVTLSGTYAPSLEFTNEVTEYEPYQGTSYPISLGQTVYGGTLDVVSGKLDVDWAKIDMGSLNWGIWNGKFVASLPDAYQSLMGSIPLVSEIYKTGQWGSSASQGEDMIWITGSTSNAEVYVQDSTYTDKTAFKTAVTGKYMAYKLKTPTEVTLTPTEVNTLLGQNNIWADSGDVTVEIGQNPYVLVNPTLFEACPLIEFNSSGEDGEINLGSRQIKVLSAILGRVNLGLDVSGSKTTTRTWQDVITVQNAGSFNAGDILRFNGGKVIFTFNFTPINVEVVSQGTDLKASWQRGSNNLELSLNNLEFPAGTDTTYSFTSDIKVKASLTPSIEGTETFTVTTSYNRNGVLTITWAGGNYSFGEYTYIQGASNYTGYGDSTKNSLEDVDIYVDLDIGEAYSIDSDDNVVSLNNFVNLGGELPTLDPGATEITTDSSISNVKVTPRWWKV